jgi:hypothetical protein
MKMNAKVGQLAPVLSLERVPNEFWKCIANQRSYFDWIGQQLNIQRLDDWHRVTFRAISRFPKVSSILLNYNSSLFQALKAIYPEVEWNPLSSKSVPQKHWKSKENHRTYFNWLAQQVCICLCCDY